MKLLVDAMWPPELSEQLRTRSHDVIAIVERPDHRTDSDEDVFALAQSEERALFTEDTDFRGIAVRSLLRGQWHAGLVFTNPQRFPRARQSTLGRVVTALDELLASDPDLTNRDYWLS